MEYFWEVAGLGEMLLFHVGGVSRNEVQLITCRGVSIEEGFHLSGSIDQDLVDWLKR